MMRAASILCGLLTVGLLGLAGYGYIEDRDPPPGISLVVLDPDRDLGPRPCGAVIPVRFRVVNRSPRPIRVLGLAPG